MFEFVEICNITYGLPFMRMSLLYFKLIRSVQKKFEGRNLNASQQNKVRTKVFSSGGSRLAFGRKMWHS
ncbi:unnamed protein product [Cylicocyclus nassatus]|uniref:Uncharacterized protein n=1 Tax=Cylicocyclus nassatus TaxID=53992 RepID=A0AA36GP44_CYLNA|nr:unnamed protein product [Cylicocyclus nassatus]